MAACSSRADANPNAPTGPISSAQAQAAQAALRGTQWSLVEIEGKVLSLPEGRRAPTLQLTDGGRASGFAGCNQWSASYTSTGDDLRLSAMIMTRMFCNDAMDLEKQYSTALEAARSYRIKDGRLELLADGKTVAAFEKR
jgi:putative lipoprotein